MDVEKVRAEARAILDKFGAQLKEVKISSKIVFDGKDKGVRDEKKGNICDNDFRTIMFKNAPHFDEECLILEKASW